MTSLVALAAARPEAGYSYSPPSTSYGAPSGGGGSFGGTGIGGGFGGGGHGGGFGGGGGGGTDLGHIFQSSHICLKIFYFRT